MTRATPTSSLSRRQLQDRWNLSESTVDRVLRRHADLLPAFRVGHTVRVWLTDVEAFESRSQAFITEASSAS